MMSEGTQPNEVVFVKKKQKFIFQVVKTRKKRTGSTASNVCTCLVNRKITQYRVRVFWRLLKRNSESVAWEKKKLKTTGHDFRRTH